MNFPRFVPLRLHSEYSMCDSTIKIKKAVEFARKQKFFALALTDAMNLFGIIKFYKECRNKGIVPIIGVDVLMEAVSEQEEPSRLLLLAKNEAAYKTLCDWLTRAYTQHRKPEPCLAWQWLEEGGKDFICLSGGNEGRIAKLALANRKDEAVMAAQNLARLFPDSFYLEIQRFGKVSFQGIPEVIAQKAQKVQQKTQEVAQVMQSLAQQLDLPLVATHPIQFMMPEDFMAHEARVCINDKDVIADPKRAVRFHPAQYFLSCDEMERLFEDLPEALDNAQAIAQRCAVELKLGKPYLPEFPTPQQMPLADYLAQQANEGLRERLIQLFPDDVEREARRPSYEERLNFELNIIIQMDFPGYFLIVADFINWAKNNGCPVGPGRGSGAGSLVAFSLKITDLDPISYHLLFERFLNPERKSMPDFDVDFCQANRDRVIDYVRQKYGDESVGQIVTFGTMAARAVIKDVTRVMGRPYGLGDHLAKLIDPKDKEKGSKLQRTYEGNEEFRQTLQQEEAENLYQTALKLEDLARGTGMHAGGVIMSPGKLTNFCPIYQADEESSTVSMYDKDDVEAAGLVKFDFLGLRNLTSMKAAVDLIQEKRNINIDLAKIPLNDSKVFRDIFSNADTTAVFQFESDGMKKMLSNAKPTVFEDLIAFVSLYRPGPMQFVDDYIARMHGDKKVEYLVPQLETILKETYGVMVYQEQVMQTAQICAGYTLGAADSLRRAMGKKKPEEMKQHRTTFIEGAKENKISTETANKIFDEMERFAGYGFNKSHAAAYSLISYQTAWLKYYYRSEFLAATMNTELENTDQICKLIGDAKQAGIECLPVDINESIALFDPVNPQSIRYGLAAIKGVGKSAAEHIVDKRKKGGVFKDIFDFFARVDSQCVNKKSLESLFQAGAFDGLHKNRAQLVANVDFFLKYAKQEEAGANQGDLFADFDMTPQIEIPDYPSYNSIDFAENEKLSYGFYYSGIPFLKEIALHERLDSTYNAPLGTKRSFWVMVKVVQYQPFVSKEKEDKQNKKPLSKNTYSDKITDKNYAFEVSDGLSVRTFFLRLDENGQARLDKKNKEPEITGIENIIVGKTVFLYCHLDFSYNEYKKKNNSFVRVVNIRSFEDFIGKEFKIVFNIYHQSDKTIHQLHQFLQKQKNNPHATTPWVLNYQIDRSSMILKPENNWKIVPSLENLLQLQGMIGKDNISFVAQMNDGYV